MPTSMPHSQLAAVIQSLGSRLDEGATPAVRTLRRDLQEQFEAVGNETTPYGKLMQHIDMGIPEAREVPFISPFALLFKVCRTSENFRNLLRSCVRGNQHARLVFYSDDITPGNVLRPDTGRTMACCYWTLMEFPQWFRSRAHGWFPLCYLRAVVYKKIAGGMSAVWGHLLHQFFGDPWDFETACALKSNHQN